MLQGNEKSAWEQFWSFFSQEFRALNALEKKIGYSFKQRGLIYEALAHRSSVDSLPIRRLSEEAGFHFPWNERLEFLGDSVLGLIITTALWERGQHLSEGELSRTRSYLVREKRLGEIALNLGLGEALALGKGERRETAERLIPLLADALEALIGAVYLDSSLDRTAELVHRLFDPYMDEHELAAEAEEDHKTTLQELAQQRYRVTPRYVTLRAQGKDHQKLFEVAVMLNDEQLGVGQGSSKKRASAEAARIALEKVKAAKQPKENRPC